MADYISCSSCGFLNKTKKKQCSECGEPLIIPIKGTGQNMSFNLRGGLNHAFYKENDKKHNVCTFKKTSNRDGKEIKTFSIGEASKLRKEPGTIELYDKNQQYLGHFQDRWATFECSLGSFTLDKIGTWPFRILDLNGKEVLSLVKAPGNDKNIRGVGLFNGFILTSTGILNHNLCLIISMTMLYFHPKYLGTFIHRSLNR